MYDALSLQFCCLLAVNHEAFCTYTLFDIAVSKCNPLSAPANGLVSSCTNKGNKTVTTDKQDYNTLCHTECSRGYTAQFSSSRRCLADGTWRGINQLCLGKIQSVYAVICLILYAFPLFPFPAICGPVHCQADHAFCMYILGVKKKLLLFSIFNNFLPDALMILKL